MKIQDIYIPTNAVGGETWKIIRKGEWEGKERKGKERNQCNLFCKNQGYTLYGSLFCVFMIKIINNNSVHLMFMGCW
jgi:hypothetical protein